MRLRWFLAFAVVPLAPACGGDGAKDTAGSGGAGAASSTASTSAGAGATGGGGGIALPPANGKLDYQLGGAYPPPPGVEVLVRDRAAAPAPGTFNICYVNGFQAQPQDNDWWLENHPTLVLRDAEGDPIVDVDWNEMLLDVSTAEKRAAIATIVGDWIDGCAAAGFDAAEIDNLDSYTRSTGLLDADDAVEMMTLLSAEAHAAGLAIAQKNAAELLDRRAEMGTDFAVSEECNRWEECDAFVAAYGDLVFVVEYRQEDFALGCASFSNLSIVLRDLDLVTPSDPAYVYDDC